MADSFQRSGNLVALKMDKKQLIVYDLQKLDNEKIIECDASIDAFTINEKDNLVAIILETQTIVLFDVSLNRKIKHQNQMQYSPFRIIFIHLGALWLGRLTQSDGLQFNIQQINDFSQMICSAQTGLTEPMIANYHVNKDWLLCVFKCDDDQNKIIKYQLLDSREIKQRQCWQIKAANIVSIRINSNNTLIVIADDVGTISLIDGDQIIEYRTPSPCSIQTIDFDLNQHQSFSMTTEKAYHFCFYWPDKLKCIRHDSLPKSENSLLIAYRMPYMYVFKEPISGVSVIKSKHLASFLNYQNDLKNIIDVDPDQFKKHLYDCKTKDGSFWRMLAQKSIVDYKDIDQALICVARMGDAGLVRFLKQEQTKDGSSGSKTCFILMLHLDLIEESEYLLENSDKNQLSQLLCLQDRWEEAFACADTIELKNLYYKYGQQMEMENNILEAIEYYEKSGNVMKIVKMLCENENLVELKNYCLKKQEHNGQINKQLVSWWGQYCESQGDHVSALEMYTLADDYYNLVRLLCNIGQMDQAIQLIDEHLIHFGRRSLSNKQHPEMAAAILFLGKHLESIDSLQSIEYYLQASAIRHAIRVCIAHEHFDKLVEIAVQHSSENECKNILNTFFNNPDDVEAKQINEENMATLYYKAGEIKQSILFAIEHRLWDFLRNILGKELEKDQRNFVIEQTEIDLSLEYLKQDANIIDIVIDLILMSDQKHLDTIGQVINQYGTNLNDGLFDKLESYISKHHNQKMMNTIAELCLERGNYGLAAKLYNKIGKRIDSIKALIRTGQSDKIIQFANVARDRTVFKLAANFLQTINHPDTDLVIKFYTKADAHEELARYRNMLTSINQQ